MKLALLRRKQKRQEKRFEFKHFSKKQLKLLNWWREGSKYKEYDIIIADGAIRSGKTIAMICSFLMFTQTNFKGENFIIAGKTIGSLKKNVIEPMKQILNAWGWRFEYNRSENFLVIGSNTYYMYDANNEASQDKLQGLTAAGALADEVALFPKNFVDQMIGRCSVDGSKIFMNCNPAGPYHFIKTEFIDKVKEKLICYLHFTMDDNLSLSEKVKNKFKRMFTGVFYKRYILGLWCQAEGVIYDMFNEKIHKVLTKLREYTEHYVSCDYGTQNATVFILWGKCKDVWYAVKEYYYDGRKEGKQNSDNKYYTELVNFLGNIHPKAIIIDPSAASFITLIRDKGKYKVKKGNNDVLNGIRNVGTALNREMIKFNDCCSNIFKEFFSYVWDEKALEYGEDKPVKVMDHAMDAIRYFVHTVLFGGKEPNYDDEIYNKGLGLKKNNIPDQYNKKGGVIF
ncbi:PBSX family phage terminase large subunit [Clostridioides difficile]|uniref:PBSX family phage terminase large subunit n=1 Tax=Clostridioides difficile TaxID=1496 RepID=UPI0003B2AC89|nr:PBSX family phage terminase large subunit [Clostridioides difficile]EGT4600797.1 PBSX family phage terminase large subunit [Clostridioides difficile]CCL06418.1 Phage terminase, large subunit, pbsx family [Clostridioides difficile CD002]